MIWLYSIGGAIVGIVVLTLLIFVWIKIGTFAFYSGKRNFERYHKKGKRNGKSQRAGAQEDNV